MFTSTHVTADLAADHTRTLLAEAETYRLGRIARGSREVSRLRWVWPRMRTRAPLAVCSEPA